MNDPGKSGILMSETGVRTPPPTALGWLILDGHAAIFAINFRHIAPSTKCLFGSGRPNRKKIFLFDIAAKVRLKGTENLRF